MSSGKWQPSCLDLNVLNCYQCTTTSIQESVSGNMFLTHFVQASMYQPFYPGAGTYQKD